MTQAKNKEVIQVEEDENIDSDRELEDMLHQLALSQVAMDKDYEEIRARSRNIDRILESLRN